MGTRFLTLLALLVSLASVLMAQEPPRSNGGDQPGILHVSFSPLDQWSSCVYGLTHKRLLLAEFNPSTNLTCPATQAELAQQLDGKGVLVPGKEWDLIVGRSTNPLDPPVTLKTTTVELKVKPWEPIEGSRQASPVELEQFSRAALGVIRPSLGIARPVANKTESGESQSGARVTLELLFDVRRLSHDGPESIIGVLRQETGGIEDGRLIYGEIRNGKPVFLWDSPRFTTRLLNLKYRDLNHDGTEEILLMGFRPSNGTIGELVAFSSTGQELTRQPDGHEGFASPIETAGEVKFVPDTHGGFELIQIPYESNEEPEAMDTYTFDQTYIKTFDRSAKALNEQGMELMKSRDYAAAAKKFTDAFRLDPGGTVDSRGAEYANNVGLAWYRAGKLGDAVLWFEQAAGLDPQRAVAFLNLGDVCFKLNRVAEARRSYEKYLELAADSKLAPEVRKKLDLLPHSR
jgi:hypothetical protein